MAFQPMKGSNIEQVFFKTNRSNYAPKYQARASKNNFLSLLTLSFSISFSDVWLTSYFNLWATWQIEFYFNISFILNIFKFLALRE